MMQKAFSLLLVMLGFTAAQAQQRVWVFFDQKPLTGVPALGPEALERRAEQGLALTPRDWPVDAAQLACLQAAGCRVLTTSRWLNAASVETTLSPAQLQQACPQITQVQPVRSLVRNGTGELLPLAPTAKTSGGTFGFSETQLTLSGITCLHEAGFRGEGITIAVFDAGFTTADTSRAFEAARTAGRITHEWDFVDNDPNVYGDSYHGLFILGTLTADLPGELMGSAPHATYILARTETEFAEIHAEESNWLAAVEWADSLGADVISSSLGYSEFDPGEGNYTYADMDGNTTIISKAADIAAALGILVVNSAGNQGAAAWHYITAPCDADSILCIGAVDQFGTQAAFSSYGPSADGQVKPDIMAMGVDVATIDPWGGVGFTSGTSLSCPVASGMVACLMQKHPLRPMMDVLQAVQQSGDRYAMPDTGYGYGIANGCAADTLLSILDAITDPGGPQNALVAYPNPGQGSLLLLAPASMSAIQFLDTQGREVLRTSGAAAQTQIATGALPEGIYLVRATLTDGRTMTTRWIRE